MNIKIKVMREQSVQYGVDYEPTRATPVILLRACLDKHTVINAYSIERIPTGLSITSEDTLGIILPRKNAYENGNLIPANLAELADMRCRDEIFVPLWNKGNEPYMVTPHEILCQILLIPQTPCNVQLFLLFENGF